MVFSKLFHLFSLSQQQQAITSFPTMFSILHELIFIFSQICQLQPLSNSTGPRFYCLLTRSNRQYVMSHLSCRTWIRHIHLYKTASFKRDRLIQVFAKPNSSVHRVADLRTGGRLFNPGLGQYSFQGLMIVIVTRLIPLLLLSIVSTMAMWERGWGLGKNIVWSTG